MANDMGNGYGYKKGNNTYKMVIKIGPINVDFLRKNFQGSKDFFQGSTETWIFKIILF